jgi:CubicO group peptidase (beta-lactamase class C family)
MNWPFLFIPAAICVVVILAGGICIAAPLVFGRRGRKPAPATDGVDLRPPIARADSLARNSRRSIWKKCFFAAGAVLVLAGLSGLAITRFSIGWKQETPVEWSDGGAPDLEALIRKHCVPFVSEGKTAGVTVAVVTATNATVMGFGRSSLSFGGSARDDTMFEIGSITKTFTGLALAREIQRGAVRLDQPIQELLPAEVEMAEAARAITLRHLTTHASGLPRVSGRSSPATGIAMLLFGSDPCAGYTEAHLLDDVRRVELEFEPGAKSSYSNLGMTLLGYLLARRANCTYEELIRREISDPLGMNDTLITPTRDQARRTAQGYRAVLRCGPLLLGLRSEPWFEGNDLGGAGGLRSTAADMLKFLQANMHPEGHPLEAALKESHRELARESEQTSYGMNWVRTRSQTAKTMVIWHNGGTGGFRSFIGFTEDRRAGVLVLSNSSESVDTLAIELLRDAAAMAAADAEPGGDLRDDRK